MFEPLVLGLASHYAASQGESESHGDLTGSVDAVGFAPWILRVNLADLIVALQKFFKKWKILR